MSSERIEAKSSIAPSVLKHIRGQVMSLVSEWSSGLSRRWVQVDAAKMLDGLERLTVACEEAVVPRLMELVAELSAKFYTAVNSAMVPSASERKQLESLLLRLRQAALSNDDNEDAEARRRANDKAAETDTTQPRAFVITANETNGAALQEQLEKKSFQVVLLSGIDKALDEMESGWPDVVLVDDPSLQRLHDLVTQTARLDGAGTRRVMFIAMMDVSKEMRVRFAIRAGADAVVKDSDVKAVATVVALEYKRFLQQAYRVLVLDDDPLTLLLCEVALQARGIHVMASQNPKSILDDVVQFKPDLILLDLYMPDANGIDVAQSIRMRREFESIPIVFLSGERDESKRFDALRAGGDEYLFKPIQTRELIGAVETRIRRARELVQRGSVGKLRERRGRLLGRVQFVEDAAKMANERAGACNALVLLSLNRLGELLHLVGFVEQDRIAHLFVDAVAAESELLVICAAGEGSVMALVSADTAGELKSRLKALQKRLELAMKPIAVGDFKLNSTLAAVRLQSLDVASAIQLVFELAGARQENLVNTLELDLPDKIRQGDSLADWQLRQQLQGAFNRESIRLEYQPWLPLKGKLTGQYLVRSFVRKQPKRRAEEWDPVAVNVLARRHELTARLDRQRLHTLLLESSRLLADQGEIRLHVPMLGETLFDPQFAPWLAAELHGLQLEGSDVVLSWDAVELKAAKRVPLLEMQALQILGVRIGLANVSNDAALLKLARLGPVENIALAASTGEPGVWLQEFAGPVADLSKLGKFIFAHARGGVAEIADMLKSGVHYVRSEKLADWMPHAEFDFSQVVF